MRYVLAVIAALWLFDGLLLVSTPRSIVTLLERGLRESPELLRWEALAAGLGLCVLIGATQLRLVPLWIGAGAGMVGLGLFLALGPDPLRQRVLRWCLTRDDLDYRFAGIGLCTLAVLLFYDLGWFPSL